MTVTLLPVQRLAGDDDAGRLGGDDVRGGAHARLEALGRLVERERDGVADGARRAPVELEE